MSLTPTDVIPALTPRLTLFGIAALLLIEFAAIGFVHTRLDAFECLANWPRALCMGLRDAMIAGYGVLGALTLFLMLFPDVVRPERPKAARQPVRPLALNAIGVVLALAPVLFLRDGAGTIAAVLTFVFWAASVPTILAGALLTLAPAAHWSGVARSHGLALLACVVFGAAVPTLAMEARPLWTIDWVVETTFLLVVESLTALGYPIVFDTPAKIIGSGDFFVEVAAPCSGIEGIALVTLFVTLYLVLFRRDLRFPLALILYPLGILASATFNVIRIVTLIALGIEGNPELAVGAFHSHAGWLTFTLVALGVIALAETVPQLKRAGGPQGAPPRAALVPLTQDPVAARILPFAVFMLTALFVSVMSETPGMLYPARMLVVAAALGLFWQIYRMLPWRVDPVAVAAGAVIGLYWVLIPVEPTDTPPYGALAGTALLLWYVVRGLGTVVFVPILEELFFRDYLESRLRIGAGLGWAIGAALVSAVIFAALHGRWAEAFVAGLIFSAVARRSGNITDAIIAHAVANAIIFAVAASTGNLALI